MEVEVQEASGVWKWIAIAALGIIGGMLEGQFQPNRNIITKEDLSPIQASLITTQDRVAELSTEIAGLKGQLAEERSFRESQERQRR